MAGERVARTSQSRPQGDRFSVEDGVEVGFGFAKARFAKRDPLGATFGTGFGLRHSERILADVGALRHLEPQAKSCSGMVFRGTRMAVKGHGVPTQNDECGSRVVQGHKEVAKILGKLDHRAGQGTNLQGIVARV